MAKGYSQIPGLDFLDVFSPVICLETIRVLLALAAVEDWEIQQMDVKGAYLNGNLKEEIFMMQPEGYSDGSNKACQLLKTLYNNQDMNGILSLILSLKNMGTKEYTLIHASMC